MSDDLLGNPSHAAPSYASVRSGVIPRTVPIKNATSKDCVLTYSSDEVVNPIIQHLTD